MNAAEREQLWTEFFKRPTPELREQIIVEYAPLVKIVAGRLSMYLGYNVEYDDLVGYGASSVASSVSSVKFLSNINFAMHPRI